MNWTDNSQKEIEWDHGVLITGFQNDWDEKAFIDVDFYGTYFMEVLWDFMEITTEELIIRSK